ncbi:MAG: site-specific integrase [archaeon]
MKPTNNSGSYLLPREVRELIAYIHSARDRILLRILYETGCTLKELVALKVSDILGKKISVVNHSTKNVRFSHISSKLAKDIKAYILGNLLKKEDFLLSSRQGKGISEKRVRQLIQQYAMDCFSKKISAHDFRYFHIAHAYTSGVLLQNIARQLGITSYRAFQVVEELGISPAYNYNNFLVRV